MDVHCTCHGRIMTSVWPFSSKVVSMACNWTGAMDGQEVPENDVKGPYTEMLLNAVRALIGKDSSSSPIPQTFRVSTHAILTQVSLIHPT